jgi:hypothetical protein
MPKKFVEFVIEGPRGWTVGFVQGFVNGRSPDAVVLDAELEGFDVSSARERIQEFVDRRNEIAHLLVREDAEPPTREAIERCEAFGRDLTVRLERPIISAQFEFSVTCFSKDCAARIRGYLEDLPSGTHLSADSRFEEFLDPEAAGAEVYAPVHDFEFRGHGVVLGDVEGVLRAHRRIASDELTDAGAIRLVEG